MDHLESTVSPAAEGEKQPANLVSKALPGPPRTTEGGNKVANIAILDTHCFPLLGREGS